MADIRIKDLATTASTTASDDFMAVDGTTNGTRKLSAATPSFATSVTVPGVSAPAATTLTLAGGSTGASLVLAATTGGVTTLSNGGVQSLRIDQSNRVIIGTGGALQGDKLEIQSTDGAAAQSIWRFSADAAGPSLTLRKSRGATIAAQGLVSSGDTIGNLLFMASDGVASRNAAQIVAEVDGTAASSSMPARIVFRTTPTGSVTLATAATLTSTGNLLIGTTTDITGSGGLHVAGTTAATTTTSGALRVGSNVGLSGNAGGASYFGGNISIVGGSAAILSNPAGGLLQTAGVAGTNNVGFAAVTNRASLSYGAYVKLNSTSISGGRSWAVSSSGDLDTGTTVGALDFFDETTAVSPFNLSGGALASGKVSVRYTTSASSSTTGALTIGNGTAATNVAIGAGNVNAGGTGTFGGNVNIAGVTTTVGAGTLTTPLLLTRVSNNQQYGLISFTANTLDATNSGIAGGGGTDDIYINGGAAGSVILRNNATTRMSVGTSSVSIPISTASTNTTSGALVVTGGVGVGGAVNVGGAATFAGAVAIGNTTSVAVAAASTHKVSILIGGVQYYLLASNV